MAFTPGPWRVGKAGGSVVADAAVPEMSGSDSVEYYGGHLVAESVTPSNQRLIATAPDLLASLQWALGHIKVPATRDEAPWVWAELDKANAVIAQAQGWDPPRTETLQDLQRRLGLTAAQAMDLMKETS